MKSGDFTGLAQNYSQHRAGYNQFLVDIVCDTVVKNFKDESGYNAIDAGAGTGIFSRMLAERGFSVAAVEPNYDMRNFGIQDSKGMTINFHEGSAEATNLASHSAHLISMASSFHWPNFDKAIAEFKRLIKPKGYFLATWNTRAVEMDPFTKDVESYLSNLVPDMKRKSSGRSEFCANLQDRLSGCGAFSDVIYLEGFHVENQSLERYIGLWRSVNDVQVQAGSEKFEQFIEYIRKNSNTDTGINAHYQTRAWLGKFK